MHDRIVLINQVTGPLFIDIANEFAKIHKNVILITGSIEPTYSELTQEIKVVYKCSYKRNKSSLRLLTWTLFFIQSLAYLLFSKGISKVLFVSNPPFLSFLGHLLSRKKWIYDVLVYDVYPDALSNFGYISKTSFTYKFWDRMNVSVFKKANRIFTISEVMKNVLIRTAVKEKVEVVYPWVDTSFIKPILKKDNWFLKKHKLLNKRIILYSGNMGITHDLMSILYMAKELNDDINDYHFLFIGDGAQKEKLLKFSIDQNLENVTFLPYQEPDVLPYSFGAADFGIVSLGKGAEGLSVPSKTFYLLAAGVAIISISPPGSEIERIINNCKCGISIEPHEFAEAVDFMKNTSNDSLLSLKKNARNLSFSFSKLNATKFL